MKTKIKLGTPSIDGTIYQISDVIEGRLVVINITYSSGETINGNDVLEFECARAEESNNLTITAEQLREVNKILECGREEEYVKILFEYYKSTPTNFDPNEYRYAMGLATRDY